MAKVRQRLEFDDGEDGVRCPLHRLAIRHQHQARSWHPAEYLRRLHFALAWDWHLTMGYLPYHHPAALSSDEVLFADLFGRLAKAPSQVREPEAKKMRKADGLLSSKPPSPSSSSASTTSSSSSGRMGLITFRPHSDSDRQQSSSPPTSSWLPGTPTKRRHDGSSCYHHHQHHQRGVNNSPSRVRIQKKMPALRSGNRSACSRADAGRDADVASDQSSGPRATTIRNVLPECLSHVFSFLDVASRGRAAQACRSWRDACYEKSVWRGAEARMHLPKRVPPGLFASLRTRGIKKVQVLSLEEPRSLKALVTGLPRLESLNLSGCCNVTDYALNTAFSRDCPSLKSLDVSLCKDVSDGCLGKVTSRCKNLELLNLAGCSKISNYGLLFISSLKQMRALNLKSCRLISDDGILHLAGGRHYQDPLPKLEELVLQDCQRLTDESLKHLSRGMRSIESLNLSFCVSVTDTGLKSLARLPKLRELNLRWCDNVSDLGVGFLAEADYCADARFPGERGCARQLRRLDASFCANVTDTSARHVAAGMPGLRWLSLSNSSLTDDGLSSLASSLKHLESLYIGQCSRVTDAGVDALAKERASTLRRLDLYGCTGVSLEATRRLRRMPKLGYLNLSLHMK